MRTRPGWLVGAKEARDLIPGRFHPAPQFAENGGIGHQLKVDVVGESRLEPIVSGDPADDHALRRKLRKQPRKFGHEFTGRSVRACIIRVGGHGHE